MGCGKVADPKPPFIRIPEAIRDLSATQNGYNVLLSWTNPAHNVDGSAATDLATVHITSTGSALKDVPPAGPGKAQSEAFDARNWVDTQRFFEVKLETTRGKFSAPASISITPIEVPGTVRSFDVVVYQYAITLTWQPPAENPRFANAYIVSRADRQEPIVTTETQWSDAAYDRGKEYTFEVVAARRLDNNLTRGVGPQR